MRCADGGADDRGTVPDSAYPVAVEWAGFPLCEARPPPPGPRGRGKAHDKEPGPPQCRHPGFEPRRTNLPAPSSDSSCTPDCRRRATTAPTHTPQRGRPPDSPPHRSGSCRQAPPARPLRRRRTVEPACRTPRSAQTSASPSSPASPRSGLTPHLHRSGATLSASMAASSAASSIRSATPTWRMSSAAGGALAEAGVPSGQILDTTWPGARSTACGAVPSESRSARAAHHSPMTLAGANTTSQASAPNTSGMTIRAA
jgi:hypothetical protein